MLRLVLDPGSVRGAYESIRAGGAELFARQVNLHLAQRQVGLWINDQANFGCVAVDNVAGEYRSKTYGVPDHATQVPAGSRAGEACAQLRHHFDGAAAGGVCLMNLLAHAMKCFMFDLSSCPPSC